ncbi:MAG: CU044_5270 family protein [Kineosporiaceae bacterium]
MNDLDLLHEYGQRLGSITPESRERIRARVLEQIRSEETAGRRSRVRPGLPKLLWVMPIGGAVVAAGLVVSGVVPPRSDRPMTPSTSMGQGAQEGGPVVALDARQILLAAAETARSEAKSEKAPDPNAFVYIRLARVGKIDEPSRNTVDSFETSYEAWRSVNGRRDGAFSMGSTSAGGFLQLMKGCPAPAGPKPHGDSKDHSTTCDTFPGYVSDVPSDPKGALAYLHKDERLGREVGDDMAFQNAEMLLMNYLLPAESRAAIFEALAMIPGVSRPSGVVTIAGHKGVVVGMTLSRISDPSNEPDARKELIFDSTTHRLLGARVVLLEAGHGLNAGSVLYTDIVRDQTVVAAVRLRPDGTTRTGPFKEIVCIKGHCETKIITGPK